MQTIFVAIRAIRKLFCTEQLRLSDLDRRYRVLVQQRDKRSTHLHQGYDRRLYRLWRLLPLLNDALQRSV